MTSKDALRPGLGIQAGAAPDHACRGRPNLPGMTLAGTGGARRCHCIDPQVTRDVAGARFPGDICSKLVSAGDPPLPSMLERRPIRGHGEFGELRRPTATAAKANFKLGEWMRGTIARR